MNFHAVLLILVSVLVTNVAQARAYPERGNTEFHFLPDFPIDQDVKISRINAAKFSIDFVTFSQTNDEMGRQFLKAIREAQKRGVKVRMLYDRLFSLMEGDWSNEVRTIVTDPSLGCPGEVTCPHPTMKSNRGISVNDYIHEKILLIDAGTENEIAFIGGRGFTQLHSNFLDSAYAIRPMDYRLPYLGDDIQDVFNRLWKVSQEVSVKGPPSMVLYGTDDASAIDDLKSEPFAQTPAHVKTVQALVASLEKPANRPLDPKEPANGYRSLIQSVRMLSNSLFEQLMNAPKGTRPEVVKNDIQTSLIKDLDRATGTFEITSYSFGPTRDVLSAMARFVNRGNTIKIYSNSGANFEKYSPVPAQTPIYYSYERMVALFNLTKNSKGKIEIYLHDLPKAERAKSKTYIHRKLALLTGPNVHITYVGSDNMTWSAANKNDEIMARVNDKRFAEFHRQRNMSELLIYRRYDEKLIRKLYAERGVLYKIGKDYIRNMF